MSEAELRVRGYDPQMVKAIIIKGRPEEVAAAIFQAGLIKVEGPMTMCWSLCTKAMNEVATLIGREDDDLTEDVVRCQYMIFAMKYVMAKNRPTSFVPAERLELYAGMMKRFTEGV